MDKRIIELQNEIIEKADELNEILNGDIVERISELLKNRIATYNAEQEE